MPTEQEIESKLWSALRSDMTIMLGLDEDTDHPRPMTVQMESEENRGPLWIFSSNETGLVKALSGTQPAMATFASKGHDIFASIHGTLTLDNDPAKIDQLWNRFVAAWYEHGKEDPKLALLRFDLDRAEVWVDASSPVAAIKMLLGVDPKEDYKDKVAQVRLG